MRKIFGPKGSGTSHCQVETTLCVIYEREKQAFAASGHSGVVSFSPPEVGGGIRRKQKPKPKCLPPGKRKKENSLCQHSTSSKPGRTKTFGTPSQRNNKPCCPSIHPGPLSSRHRHWGKAACLRPSIPCTVTATSSAAILLARVRPVAGEPSPAASSRCRGVATGEETGRRN